ncbi:hypothetical protein KY284_019058 [Solanum tuberosum]|nr:hypothetical protein KY284_019058 [Solanum tuberosum]
MAVELWETLKDSITAYTGLAPTTFFTLVALALAFYYVVSELFGSPDNRHQQRPRDFEEQHPLPPPVQLGEISGEELKQYDGSDSKKPLLMAIKGQIHDVSQSRMFYGPGGPYALFAGKDASRVLLASKICNQISSDFTTKSPNPTALDVLLQEILDAANRNGRVFVYGVGLEGLMLKALSRKLFFLGIPAYYEFDRKIYPFCPTDLLITSAGLRGFMTVDAISRLAYSSGAQVLLLKAQPDSGSSMKYATVVAYIPAETMERVYVGGMSVLFDMVVFKLRKILKPSPEDVRARYTNLE